jgi:hypothetical protein
LASGQGEPLGAGAVWQPAIGLQESAVQALPSLHVSGVPLAQTPLWHVSFPLQTFPSLHELPSATALLAQPKTGSQLSVVQAFPSSQLSVVPPRQDPLWQVSLPLHTFPSAQDVPLSTGACAHPVAGLQLSVVQGLPSLQSSGVPVVQAPAWQVSLPSQRSLSAHDVPFASGLVWQPVIGSQVSAVQAFPSLQSSGAPLVHTPAWQVSAPLQTVPSLHDVPLITGVLVHPNTGSQPSAVQGFASVQLRAVPPVQVPDWQISLPLHTSPSAHAVPFGTAAF